MYKISVVIPAYKAEKTIRRAVESILSQKNVLTEIIIIEDGRHDCTKRVLQSYLEQLTFISFDVNLGAQFARNKGLNLSTFQNIMFLDADDYFEGDFLYYLAETAMHSNADVVFGNCIKRWESGKEKYFFQANKFRDEASIDVIIRWLTGKAGPAPCSILWKKDTLLKLGGWNEKYHKNQDGELVMRAMFNNVILAHSMEGAGIYTQYFGERISQRVDKKAFDSQHMLFDYIKKNAQQNKDKDKILDALNYYSIGIINSVQACQNEDVIKIWEKKWEKKVPKFYLIKYHGYKIYFKHLLYYIFGLKIIRKIINLLKWTKNFILMQKD